MAWCGRKPSRRCEGSELIVHAGDVGDARVLDELRAIAPTVAVRGNIDSGDWARALPPTTIVSVGELQLYVLHQLSALLDIAVPAGT